MTLNPLENGIEGLLFSHCFQLYGIVNEGNEDRIRLVLDQNFYKLLQNLDKIECTGVYMSLKEYIGKYVEEAELLELLKSNLIQIPKTVIPLHHEFLIADLMIFVKN